jgi:integrase
MKPYPDFPLTLHSTGQWCKKIGGKRYYFGTDWKAALKKYEELLHFGTATEPVIADLVESFMDVKESMRDSGEIKPDTLLEYKRTCDRLTAILGKFTPLANLEPPHFAKLRAELSGQMSATTLKGQLIRLRSIFSYAYDAGLVDQPLRFGPSMKAPAIRLLRQAKVASRDSKLFAPSEIRTLANSAKGYMKPAIWLGINCGLGNTDVCNLQWSNINGPWLDFPRPKTAVDRRSHLWPETLAALEKWKAESPDSAYVCCGRYGQRLASGESNNSPIAHRFSDIAAEVKIEGRGFYALRHTYRTIADGAGDEPAVYRTMGHADTRIGEVYRHRIEDSRLVAVSAFVRGWLFGQ